MLGHWPCSHNFPLPVSCHYYIFPFPTKDIKIIPKRSYMMSPLTLGKKVMNVSNFCSESLTTIESYLQSPLQTRADFHCNVTVLLLNAHVSN